MPSILRKERSRITDGLVAGVTAGRFHLGRYHVTLVTANDLVLIRVLVVMGNPLRAKAAWSP